MSRKINLVKGIIIALFLGMSLLKQSVSALTNNLLLQATQSNYNLNSEVNIDLRVNTSTSISGLSVTVVFMPSQLEFITSTDAGSEFPVLYAETPDQGKVTIVRARESGSVTGNRFVTTLKFKAISNTSNAVVEATGTANANNSPLSLAKGSVSLSIGNTATGTAPSSSSTPTSNASNANAGEGSNNNVATGTDNTGSDLTENNNPASIVSQASSGNSGVLTAINPISAFSENGTRGSRIGWAFLGMSILLTLGWILFKKIHHRAQLAGHFPDIHSPLFTPEEMAQTLPKDTQPPNSTDDSSIPPALGNAYNPADTVVIKPQTIQPSSSVESSGTIQSPAPTIHHDFAQSTPPTITPTPAGQAPDVSNKTSTSSPTLINPDETAS